jgi:hypothetical protein
MAQCTKAAFFWSHSIQAGHSTKLKKKVCVYIYIYIFFRMRFFKCKFWGEVLLGTELGTTTWAMPHSPFDNRVFCFCLSWPQTTILLPPPPKQAELQACTTMSRLWKYKLWIFICQGLYDTTLASHLLPV